MRKLFESLLNQLDENTKSHDKALLSWTLTLVASAFDVIVSKKRQNDRWTFLTGEFGRNEKGTLADPKESTLQRGYAIKKKFHPGLGAGTAGSAGIASQQQKLFLPAKNYYKKLSDQLEKMKQSESISQSKLEKLQNRLSHMQSLYAKLHQQEPATESSSSADVLSGTQSTSKGKQSRDASTSAQQLASNKIRQYSIRLRLPLPLCLEIVKRLLAILSRRSSHTVQLQLQTQLIAFKVVSKICVHGCSQPIPISMAFDGYLTQLLILVKL